MSVTSSRRALELEMRPVSAETEKHYLQQFPGVQSVFMNEAGQLFGYRIVKGPHAHKFHLFILHHGRNPSSEKIASGTMTTHPTKGIMELHSFEKRQDFLDAGGVPIKFKGIAAFRARIHAALRVANPLWMRKIYLIAANEKLAVHYSRFGFKSSERLFDNHGKGLPLIMNAGRIRLRRFVRKEPRRKPHPRRG